ncbi:hypothetical protein M3Y98_00659300 [Aphelenchoides besseyi]|nr:hypothetical protein M3Y98_00659300 [Aphelenchoides besseyi]
MSNPATNANATNVFSGNNGFGSGGGFASNQQASANKPAGFGAGFGGSSASTQQTPVNQPSGFGVPKQSNVGFGNSAASTQQVAKPIGFANQNPSGFGAPKATNSVSGFGSGFNTNQQPLMNQEAPVNHPSGFGIPKQSNVGFAGGSASTQPAPMNQQPVMNQQTPVNQPSGFGAQKISNSGFNAGGFGSNQQAPVNQPTGFAAPNPSDFGVESTAGGFNAGGFNAGGFNAGGGFGSNQQASTNRPSGFGNQNSGNFGAPKLIDSNNGFGGGSVSNQQPVSANNTSGFGGPKQPVSGFGINNASGFAQQTSMNQPSGFGAPNQSNVGFNAGGFGSNQQAPVNQQPSMNQQSGFDASKTSDFGNAQENDDSFTSVAQNQSNDERQSSRYVPAVRELDDIFQEDIICKFLYESVVDADDDVIVEPQENVLKIDSWSDITLNEKLMMNINRSNYARPRKIQSYTIPYILEGKDLKGQAETGSGKSAAFLIPIIHKIAKIKEANTSAGSTKNNPYCVIVEPTRELALQLYEQGRKLAHDTGVQVVKSYGEYKWAANAQEILEGCDIIVGTPGRLYHFMNDGIIQLNNLQYFVLDEADRLLDQNFKEIVDKMKSIKKFPKQEALQTLLFSATFPEDVDRWAKDMLKEDFVYVKNARGDSANRKIHQQFRECQKSEKKEAVLEILKQELEDEKKNDVNAKQPRTLVFVKMRRDADVMAMYLCESGVQATTINGDRTQKLREEALRSFRENSVSVLVATDVCARGLDIKDLDNVINMDLPQEITTYIHRIGRTGRLKQGRATSLFDPSEDGGKFAKDLAELLKKDSYQVPDYILNAADNTSNFGGSAGDSNKKPRSNNKQSFGNQWGNSGNFGFGNGEDANEETSTGFSGTSGFDKNNFGTTGFN